MLLATKIRLKPTKEQEELFFKSCGVARWAYNYFLNQSELHYNEYLNGNRDTKTLKELEVRKEITQLKKTTAYSWLNEVGSNVIKQAIKDADIAKKRFLSGTSSYPKYKSKKFSTPSFYVNYESLKRTKEGFKGEKLGIVKTCQSLPKLKKHEKYSNPRITYDGKYWYLSIGYNVEFESVELTDESLGIDLGIKDLAICSNGIVYKNINKTKEVKRLEKKLKREQRKLSRKINNNIESYNNKKPVYKKPLEKMKNIQKQKNKVKMIHKRLSNIRNNYIHQVTSEIVKTKPFRIVIEDLNVKGMMKNKHLSKAIQQQCFYEFRRQLEYKCKKYGIELVIVDRFYPSSKTCSGCGHIKKDLKLSDRTYICEECGLVIDRDLNASINLANYQI